MYVFNVIEVQWVTMVIISGLCSQTQKFSKIASLRCLRQERNRLHQSVCCRQIWPSASQRWCPWVCPSWGEWTWFLSMLKWRSVAHTTVRCFWRNSYFLSCMRSVASSLSSSKANLLSERAWRLTFWNETPAFI